jgi:DNA modification methylase
VLDPFAGSGTTLVVAERLGRNAVGIDLNPDYTAMAERRLELERAERAGGGRAGDGRVWQMAALPLPIGAAAD